MLKPIRFTSVVSDELARLHGSAQKAQAFRSRSLLPERPTDGPWTLKERVLNVSDLHLVSGSDPETGQVFACEGFLSPQEEQFKALLADQWAKAALGLEAKNSAAENESADMSRFDLLHQSGLSLDPAPYLSLRTPPVFPITLLINGDFLDFPRTTIQRPALPFPDGFTADGLAPKNTPANLMVAMHYIRDGHPKVFRALAMHVALGHTLQIQAGNHDRDILNKHVWEGSFTYKVDGQKTTVGGFKPLIDEELRRLGMNPQQRAQCLERVRLSPVNIFADVQFEHGDEGDATNRTQRPLKELFDPTPLHTEMDLAYGDMVVRAGFNRIEQKDPLLDGVRNKLKFFARVVRHPKEAWGLARACVKGFGEGGYEESKKADAETRRADLRQLVDKFPGIAGQLNALRPAGENLTADQIKDGLCEIDKHCATPLFSNFPKASSLFTRLFKVVTRNLVGWGKRDELSVERLDAANRTLGINKLVTAHTHAARDEWYLNGDEKLLQVINSHTWLNREGEFGWASNTWRGSDRGVVVLDLGVDEKGQPWRHLRLKKVTDSTGELIKGQILEQQPWSKKKTLQATVDIFGDARV